MVPQTYPSNFSSNGRTQMRVFFLTSIVGLKRWTDYIPVKLSTGGVENSYNNNGYINVSSVTLTPNSMPFNDYVPVYVDQSATDAWQVNDVGYIPYGYAMTGTASLMLDFINGTALDSRITFTRSSTATRTNNLGVIESVAINTPRFDYDPVTLTSKGLLIEEQRTQLLLNSLITGVTVTTQSVTTTAVATTLSFYGTGQVVLSGSATATIIGSNLYPTRTTYTFTPTVGVLVLTVTGIVQFAQLEVGAFATSFIPSGGSVVIRTADLAIMTGTNFSNWYNQSAGTFITKWSLNGDVKGKMIYQADDGTSSNVVRQRYGTTGSADDGAVIVGGVVQATLSSVIDLSINTFYKSANAYSTNDFARSVIGSTVSTDISGTTPTVNRMSIGYNAVNGVEQICGYIQQIAYFPTRLSNAELQTISVV